MKLLFQSTSKKGKGRGKLLGYPTINLVIPDKLPLVIQPGIYASSVTVKDKTYKAALYYGTTPTFEDTDYSLELYLIDADHIVVFPGEPVLFEVAGFIRSVQKFDSPELLVRQMEDDVKKIKSILV